MTIEVGDSGSKNNSDKKAEQTPASSQAQKQAPAPAPAPAAQTTSSTAGQQQQATIKQPSQQGTRSMNISSRTNYGMSRAATSHAMRAIVEVTDKIAEGEADRPIKYTFIALDGEKEGLLISAYIVVATVKNAGNDALFAAHHTLILGQTAKGVSAVEAQWGQGMKYERLVVPADAYDATLRARVVEAVQQQFPGYALIDAEAEVVPADLDLRSEEAVRNIVANATTAASTMLAGMIADDAWVIDENVLSNTFLNEVKVSWGHMADLAAQPVRSDVVLEMSMMTGKNQNTNQQQAEFQYNTSQAKRLITQLMGYIDVIYTPLAAGGFGATANVATTAEELKVYTPRLVLTNIDAPDEAVELPVILQGLGTVQALANNSQWVAALVKQHVNGAEHAQDGVNIRDISAIGLEVPQQLIPGFVMPAEGIRQQRLPLSSANVNEAAVAAAINTYFRPDLLVSLDVPECGPSSWITAPFAAAARGDRNAERDIVEAADLLTGGRFSEIYKSTPGGGINKLIFNDNMYVNLGYYHAWGGKRDIRDIDYLAVLNMTGDAEMETINDWANLQANDQIDPMFRLTSTREIQSRLFESLTITGRAVRITFNPAFIYALAKAVEEAGLVYETKIGMASPTTTARMVPAYMRGLQTGLGNAGAFMAQGMRRQSPTGAVAGSFGRYAHARANQGGQGSGNY